ncbi:MAG: ATP-dependent metallopeptidase FtsH/Yme1/Tma family protein [Chloroflexi bacterium]|nr:ATP-dependent metallopeptidase FtsH/Yme1/Tma family protein [Chloroflexota bacterium]
MNSRWLKNGFVYFLIAIAGALLLFNFYFPNKHVNEIPLNKLAAKVKSGEVKKISVQGDDLSVIYKGSGLEELSRKENRVGVVESLKSLGVTPDELKGVEIDVQSPSDWGNWLTLLGSFLPLLIFGGFLLFMMRQAQGTNNQALMFGKSRARVFTGDKPTVTFGDVAGVEEAKQELQEVVEFLKEPGKFSALGARIPKGVLLVGPPGAGKTLMARAVAGEAGVPFFSISGSEFVEMFVGVGASRVRDLFDQAKRNAPCIIFIDEVDAVGRHRGAGLGGSHDEREQTLNQILVEMDGFDNQTNIIIIAATNRPDILDPALLRPGRFDRRVVLDRADLNGRKAILEVHTKGKPLAAEIDLHTVAAQTIGFSGADLENLVNEAAILAARRNLKAIGMKEFQESIEKVIAGPERRSRVVTPEEKRVIAYHEAGHAVVAKVLPLSDTVQKVVSISRGMALGYTLIVPNEDRYMASKAKFEDDLAGLLGGRAAEEIVFQDITTGASNDLERATKIARAMVTQYGMSKRLGPRTFGKKDDLVFLGREISEQRNYSGEIAELIDEEVRCIIDRAYLRAKQTLTTYRDKLDTLAKLLTETESVDKQQFDALFV